MMRGPVFEPKQGVNHPGGVRFTADPSALWDWDNDGFAGFRGDLGRDSHSVIAYVVDLYLETQRGEISWQK